MGNILIFLEYKLHKARQTATIFNIQRKIRAYKIIKDKKQMHFMLLRASLLIISLFTLYMALITQRTVWIIFTYVFAFMINNLIYEYHLGHWKHWDRERKKQI